jgi:hypothetical protein
MLRACAASWLGLHPLDERQHVLQQHVPLDGMGWREDAAPLAAQSQEPSVSRRTSSGLPAPWVLPHSRSMVPPGSTCDKRGSVAIPLAAWPRCGYSRSLPRRWDLPQQEPRPVPSRPGRHAPFVPRPHHACSPWRERLHRPVLRPADAGLRRAGPSLLDVAGAVGTLPGLSLTTQGEVARSMAARAEKA